MESFDNGFMEKIISEGKKHSEKFIGRGKILVAGKTGIGKSALINAVFGKETCKTGSGVPVTQNIEEFSTPESLITLVDSKGLELLDYKRILDDLISYIENKNSSDNPYDHINLCWLCVDYQGRRVEDAEIDLHRRLAGIGVKIIVVLTKYYLPYDKEFEGVVNNKFSTRSIKVNSINVADENGSVVVKVRGLEDLVNLTNDLLPEAQRTAFLAAQRVDKNKKIEVAKNVVHGSSVAAASAAGLNPLPMPDATFIIPIQVGMMIGVNKVFNISTSNLKSLLVPILGPLALGYAGPQLVGFIVKFVPGLGTIAGGVINASVAATITETVGMTYVSVVGGLYSELPLEKITMEEIAKRFKDSSAN